MIEEKIRQLYQIVDELEAAYPEKHFTLDGILMSNLGEVYAAERYKKDFISVPYEPKNDGYLK